MRVILNVLEKPSQRTNGFFCHRVNTHLPSGTDNLLIFKLTVAP